MKERIYDHTIQDEEPASNNEDDNDMNTSSDDDNTDQSNNENDKTPVESVSFSFAGFMSITGAVLLAIGFILVLYLRLKQIIEAFEACLVKPSKQPAGNLATTSVVIPPQTPLTTNEKPVQNQPKTSKTDVVPVIEVATKSETEPKPEKPKKQKKARPSKERPEKTKNKDSKQKPKKSENKENPKKSKGSKKSKSKTKKQSTSEAT